MLQLKNKNRKPGSPGAVTAWMSEKGFTLLEVLLAFFIFSILLITLYSGYSGTFKTINMTENRMALYRKAAITLERISEDLQASYISVLPQNSFGEPAGYTQFLGTDNEVNGHYADSLNFFSRLQPLFSNEDETVSGLMVSYNVISGNEEDELVLLRSESPEFMDEVEAKEGLIVSDGLQSINFTYFDDDGEVHASWDSDSEEFRDRLPRIVSIALEYLNHENPDAPFRIMTSVSLPVHYMLPQQQ